MSEPANIEEYNLRCMQNNRIEGYGVDVAMVMPCPGCGAAEWCTYKIVEMEQVTAQPHTCKECERSFKLIYTKDAATTAFEIVQTSGPQLPDWFPFPMRRVDS